MKQCYKCTEYKDNDGFPPGKNKCRACLNLYKAEYYLKNKTEINAQQKEYYEINKATVLTYQKEYYYSNDGKINSIFNTAKRRAAKKNIPFDLTKDWIISNLERQDYRCALTKLEFVIEQTDSHLSPYMPSLDRIDCSRGYTQDNVRIVCAIVNMALNEFGEEAFENMCKAYIQASIDKA